MTTIQVSSLDDDGDVTKPCLQEKEGAASSRGTEKLERTPGQPEINRLQPTAPHKSEGRELFQAQLNGGSAAEKGEHPPTLQEKRKRKLIDSESEDDTTQEEQPAPQEPGGSSEDQTPNPQKGERDLTGSESEEQTPKKRKLRRPSPQTDHDSSDDESSSSSIDDANDETYSIDDRSQSQSQGDDANNESNFIDDSPQSQSQGSPPPTDEAEEGDLSHRICMKAISKVVDQVASLVQCGTTEDVDTWFVPVSQNKILSVEATPVRDVKSGTCSVCKRQRSCNVEIRVKGSHNGVSSFFCGRWCGRRIKAAFMIGAYLRVGNEVKRSEVDRLFGLATNVMRESATTPDNAPANMLNLEPLYPSSDESSSSSEDEKIVLDDAIHKRCWNRFN